MADKIKVKAARKGSNGLLDLGMAALAAGSVAFVTFAMPDDIFSGLVSASGLPSAIPAAQPPLGATARMAAIGLAAGATFLLVWSLLRALGKPKGPKRARGSVEVPADPPRLRRADAHPDAPSRHPILAGRDLGASLDEIDVEEETFKAAPLGEPERPMPRFLRRDLVSEASADPAEPEHREAQPPEVVTSTVEPGEQPAAAAPVAEQTSPAPDPVDADADADADVGAEAEPFSTPADDFDDAGWDRDEITRPAVEPVAVFLSPQPVDDFLAEPLDRSEDRPEEVEAPAPRLAPVPEGGRTPIPSLMQRLELGLQRRDPSDRPRGVDADGNSIDDRLRSAIGDLHRLSTRRG